MIGMPVGVGDKSTFLSHEGGIARTNKAITILLTILVMPFPIAPDCMSRITAKAVWGSYEFILTNL
jgi:hypothetical protein